MQMGDIVAATRGEGGPLRPSMIKFLTSGIDRFQLQRTTPMTGSTFLEILTCLYLLEKSEES
jgi:hypothetical protein